MQTATIPTAWRNDAPLAARNYSTDEAAAVLKVKPQTLRAALCRDGAYQGVRPLKARNRFLLWPAAEIERLAAGGVAQ
jgi:hypothetical protein